MNSYEISFTESNPNRAPGEPYARRVVVGTQQSKNGIQAIRDLLRERFGNDMTLLLVLAEGRSIGSNKRLVVAGITFEAKKL